MSSVALLALRDALLAVAMRIEREKLAAERMTAAFGEPVTVQPSFTFELVDG